MTTFASLTMPKANAALAMQEEVWYFNSVNCQLQFRDTNPFVSNDPVNQHDVLGLNGRRSDGLQEIEDVDAETVRINSNHALGPFVSFHIPSLRVPPGDGLPRYEVPYAENNGGRGNPYSRFNLGNHSNDIIDLGVFQGGVIMRCLQSRTTLSGFSDASRDTALMSLSMFSSWHAWGQGGQQASTQSNTVNFGGAITYRKGALLLSHGKFSGYVISDTNPPQLIYVEGYLNGIGFQIGVISGEAPVRFSAPSIEALSGSNQGGLFQAELSFGAGPATAVGGEGTLGAFPNRQGGHSFTGSASGQFMRVSPVVSAFDLLERPKFGAGFGASFTGITVGEARIVRIIFPDE